MLNKAQKKELVEKLAGELAGLKGAVLSSFQGVPAAEIQNMRKTLRAEGVKTKVVKLSLLRRILEKLGVDVSKFQAAVPLALSWSHEDEALPSRLLHAFGKRQENLKLIGGILGSEFLDAARVKSLATLPGKQELRGQVVSVIAAPLRGLVSVLAGNLRALVSVLNSKLQTTNSK